MTSFKQSAKYQEQLGDIDLQVNVLTAGYWPPYTPTELAVPNQVGY
jgi:cullin-4